MQAVAVMDAEGNPIGEYRYNGAVANKSLELLGRHLGMFTDKQEITQGITLHSEDNFLSHILRRLEQPPNVIDQQFLERKLLEG